jgi:hypothetical protein
MILFSGAFAFAQYHHGMGKQPPIAEVDTSFGFFLSDKTHSDQKILTRRICSSTGHLACLFVINL